MKTTKINKNGGCGSSNTSILNTAENLGTHLPIELNSVFIGIMLGDGSLYRSSATSNVRF
jgi:hypothetical protein